MKPWNRNYTLIDFIKWIKNVNFKYFSIICPSNLRSSGVFSARLIMVFKSSVKIRLLLSELKNSCMRDLNFSFICAPWKWTAVLLFDIANPSKPRDSGVYKVRAPKREYKYYVTITITLYSLNRVGERQKHMIPILFFSKSWNYSSNTPICHVGQKNMWKKLNETIEIYLETAVEKHLA